MALCRSRRSSFFYLEGGQQDGGLEYEIVTFTNCNSTQFIATNISTISRLKHNVANSKEAIP